jgi:hypothetical protein
LKAPQPEAKARIRKVLFNRPLESVRKQHELLLFYYLTAAKTRLDELFKIELFRRFNSGVPKLQLWDALNCAKIKIPQNGAAKRSCFRAGA